jgi:competence ComEA-like helix-hairpin-helix protein
MRIVCLFICAGLVAGAHAQNLPEGKGREIIGGTCSECHGPEQIQGRAWTADRWRKVVSQMVDKGATLSDEETKTLLDYLIANFGPLNVNKATAKDMETTLMLSSGEADAIVRYRQMHGNFKGWDDFSMVPGVNAAKLDGIKDSVAF